MPTVSEPREQAISSLTELHAALQRFFTVEGHRWLFRGHGSVDWRLVPKAGRMRWDADDLFVLNVWRRRAIEHTSINSESEWDWAAIAQHHGLATRLLDWTLNPLVAAFFACCDTSDSDAAVFAFQPRRSIDTKAMTLKTFEGIAQYRPRGVAQRISRQTGVFTVHGPASLELTSSSKAGTLHTLYIKAGCKPKLLRELDFYGVSRQTLFPDLDGLSSYMNWYYETGNTRDTEPR